jgi:hypothetical protein
MSNLSEEEIPPCKICEKVWQRKDYSSVIWMKLCVFIT